MCSVPASYTGYEYLHSSTCIPGNQAISLGPTFLMEGTPARRQRRVDSRHGVGETLADSDDEEVNDIFEDLSLASPADDVSASPGENQRDGGHTSAVHKPPIAARQVFFRGRSAGKSYVSSFTVLLYGSTGTTVPVDLYLYHAMG